MEARTPGADTAATIIEGTGRSLGLWDSWGNRTKLSSNLGAKSSECAGRMV